MNRAKVVAGEGCAGVKSLFVAGVIPVIFRKACKDLFRQRLFQEDVFFLVQQVEGGHGGEHVQFVVHRGGVAVPAVQPSGSSFPLRGRASWRSGIHGRFRY